MRLYINDVAVRDGFQIEPRRPPLQHVDRADVLTEDHAGAVHGQVVIDELAKIGVPGGNVAVPAALLDHRQRELPSDRRAQPGSLRPDPGKPERWCRGFSGHKGGRADRPRPGLIDRIGLLIPDAATDLGGQQALTLDEETLRTVPDRVHHVSSVVAH